MEEFLRPYTEEEFDKLFKESGYPEVVRSYCRVKLIERIDELIDENEINKDDSLQDVFESWECSYSTSTVREQAWKDLAEYVQDYQHELDYGQSHEWAKEFAEYRNFDEPYEETFKKIRQANPPSAVNGLLKLFRHVAQDKGEEYLYFLVLAHYEGWGGDTTIENIIRGVGKFYPIYQQQLADGHSESYAEAYGEAIIYKGWSEEESYNYAAIIEQAMANGSDYEQAAEIAQLLTDEHLCLKEDEFLKEFKEEWQRELYYQQYVERYFSEGERQSIIAKNEVRQRIGLRPLDEHSSTE